MKRCLLPLLVALFSIGSVWAYDFYENPFYYNILTTSTVEITYDDGDEPELYSGRMTIPATVTHGGKTYSVVGVGQDAFANCADLTYVTFGSNISYIGASAFDGCSGLTAITIPSGITELAHDVFYGTGITSLVIPDNITKIGEQAFGHCDKLTEVTIGKNVTDIEVDAFFSSSKITKLTWNAINCDPYSFGTLEEVVFGDDVDSIPEDMCSGEARLYSVTFGSNIKRIGVSAFSYCTSLTSIDWPVGLTSIGANAFDGCSGLTAITIPSGITELAHDVFYGTGITSLVIPDNITKIGEQAFGSCTKLTDVTIGKNVRSIASDAFYYSDNITKLTWNAINCASYSFGTLEEVVFGDHLDSIPEDMCSNESHLNSITFGPNVKSIGASAFSYCTSLTSIDWPAGLTSIGANAFDGCSGLTAITIPSGITELAHDVFYGTGITSLVIPDNITKIGEQAFGDCDSLKEVTIGKNVRSIASDAFYYSDNITKLTWNAINCASYGFGKLEEVIVGDEVDSIPDDFCNNETKLESVTFGSNIKSIGQYAFYGCGLLTSLVLPASVTDIQDYAFAECTNIDTITSYAVTPPQATAEAFDHIDKTIPLYVPTASVNQYKSAEGWRTFWNILGLDSTAVEPDTIPDTPTDSITLYYVNSTNWDIVNAFVWNNESYMLWPGEAMTKTGIKVLGYDVYSYTFPSEYTSIIFNNSVNQTPDLTVNVATPYYYDGVWYTTIDDVKPYMPAKFYITGDSALVTDAGFPGMTWVSDAIKSETDTFVLNLKANVDYELKVTIDGTWTGKVLDYDDLTEVQDGILDISPDDNIGFRLNEDGEVKVIVTDEVFKIIGDFYVEPRLENGYYLMGTFNEWSASADYQFEANAAIEDEYTINVTLYVDDEFKVAYVKDGEGVDWYPSGENCKVDTAHAGDVTIYFRPKRDGGSGWWQGCIYVDNGSGMPSDTIPDTPTDTIPKTPTDTVIYYMIAVQADSTENGSVMGGGEYMQGETAVIMATPRKDCTFEGWSDGSQLNPRSVVVESDSLFTAIFHRNIPLPVVVCSDTMYFTSADTLLMATRVYAPSEIEAYDKMIIATVDNKNVMGGQAVEEGDVRSYRQTVAFSPNMPIADVTVVEAVPNGTYYRLRVEDGELAPRCEDCYQKLNQLYATEIGADWYFAQYENAVVPEAAAYANRMILYNEEAPRFSSYRQVTGLNRTQTTVFKLHTPRVIPSEPEVIEEDSAALVEEEKPIEEISVEIEPQDTVAVISTPYVEFVHSFTLIVWADEARAQVLMMITYDASGHVISVTKPNAVHRRAPRADGDITFEIDDLEPETTYPYTLVACEDDGSILTSLNSSFTTTNGTERIQNVFDHSSQTVKFLMNGQLFILRDGKLYNAFGVQVK